MIRMVVDFPAIGTEESGYPTRLGSEADFVDGGEVAVGSGDGFDGDHGLTFF